MLSNQPGLEDTGELGADTPVEETSQPNVASESVSAQPSELTDTPAAEMASTEGKAASEIGPESAPEGIAKGLPEEPPEMLEQPVAPAATAEPTAAETLASADVPILKRGDIVEGTVTATSPTQVMVDVGAKNEGVIPGHELEKMTKQMLESLKPGAKVMVYVVNPHDHNGNVLLSVNRAAEELDWKKAEEYRDSQQVYETRIAGYNKGGLIVRFGRLRGFVPQSQMSPERRRTGEGETPEERWGGMVNQEIAVKVMEVDRSRNRLILSERSATRESREKRKESLIGQLTVGEVRTGRVVSLEDFGAFVDIGGAEGLVHLTELSWQHVTHPRELLKVGQEVKVEVISIDPEQKRIGLSMKRQEPDPWDTVATGFTVGQLVQGTVTKLTKFGAFAQLVDLPEIEGLIHISELSDKRVTHPKEVVQEGDKLTLRVVKMDVKNRRLGLSLKKVNSAEYLDLDWQEE